MGDETLSEGVGGEGESRRRMRGLKSSGGRPGRETQGLRDLPLRLHRSPQRHSILLRSIRRSLLTFLLTFCAARFLPPKEGRSERELELEVEVDRDWGNGGKEACSCGRGEERFAAGGSRWVGSLVVGEAALCPRRKLALLAAHIAPFLHRLLSKPISSPPSFHPRPQPSTASHSIAASSNYFSRTQV